jgi:hypothetical protein
MIMISRSVCYKDEAFSLILNTRNTKAAAMPGHGGPRNKAGRKKKVEQLPLRGQTRIFGASEPNSRSRAPAPTVADALGATKKLRQAMKQAVLNVKPEKKTTGSKWSESKREFGC